MASPVAFHAPAVLSVSEARAAAPAIARRFRTEGITGEVVFFGSHRRPDAAIVPAALLEALGPFLEDLIIAEKVRARAAADSGDRTSLAELDRALGLSEADVADEADRVALELGL